MYFGCKKCKGCDSDCDCKLHIDVNVCNSLVVVIVTFLLLQL